MTFSQTGLGTIPNIAPPSNLKVPSLTACSSKSPSLCMIPPALPFSALWGRGTLPSFRRRQRESDDDELAQRESDQTQRDAAGESVGMQPHSQLIHPEPGPAHDDVAKHRKDGNASTPGQSAPAGVQQQRVPQHDH